MSALRGLGSAPRDAFLVFVPPPKAFVPPYTGTALSLRVADLRRRSGHHSNAISEHSGALAPILRVCYTLAHGSVPRKACGGPAARSPIGAVVQLVRTPACHAGGREFESRRPRQSSQLLPSFRCSRLPLGGAVELSRDQGGLPSQQRRKIFGSAAIPCCSGRRAC